MLESENRMQEKALRRYMQKYIEVNHYDIGKSLTNVSVKIMYIYIRVCLYMYVYICMGRKRKKMW